jgi:hypothetical protein
MHEVELLLVLMVAVAGLSVLARPLGVPYPILLVLGGLLLGFVPGVPDVELPPEVVLLVFLPPLLYSGAFFSSPRDLRADLRAISLSAVALVLATMVAVAVAAHAVVDGLPWGAAFALGAIGWSGMRGAEEREETRARLEATNAALARLHELAGEDWTREDTVERLQAAYDFRRRRLKARAGKIEDDGHEDRSLAYQRLVRELLEAQPRTIIRLRNQGTISSDVMHRIERDLDLEDSRLEI